MILRGLLATWIYFQVFTILKWDISFYTLGHQVLSQLQTKEANTNTNSRFVLSEGIELKRSSACASCEGTDDSVNLTYLIGAQSEISEECLGKLYDLVLEAYRKINGEFRSSRSRTYSTPQNSCDGLVDNCRNSSLLPPASNTDLHDPDEDCDALIEEMEDKMGDIIYQIELLIDAIDDPERLRMKISQLQNCVQCLEEKIDIIVKQAATEIAQCYETSLGEVTTCFATELNAKTRKIEELEVMVTNKTVNGIVSNVLASKYVEAAVEYRNLRNESLFDVMMNDLFKSRQLERILHFGRALYHENITGRAIVYTKLMQLMISNSEMIDTQNVIFHSFVKRDRLEYCKEDKFCVNQPHRLPIAFFDLATFSTPKVNSAIDKWKVNIRNNDYKRLLLFGSPEVVNYSGKAFHDITEDLVRISYDKNSNYLNGTLNFARDLRWNNQSYLAFQCLLKEANGLEDKLKIAVGMKEKMGNLVGPDEQATAVRLRFNELVKNLPQNVKGLAFGETCTLRDNGYYLYGTKELYENHNRKISMQNNPSSGSRDHKWKFERVEGYDSKYEYRIRNVQSEELLGSHIPWKYSTPSFDRCASSKPDYFEPPRKFYNWQVHFDNSNDPNTVFLYHLGRRGYLTVYGGFIDMTGSRNNAKFTIMCE